MYEEWRKNFYKFPQVLYTAVCNTEKSHKSSTRSITHKKCTGWLSSAQVFKGKTQFKFDQISVQESIPMC